MQTSVINLIREGLLEKRENLQNWQVATPDSEKQIQLGTASEADVQAELEVIEYFFEEDRDW